MKGKRDEERGESDQEYVCWLAFDNSESVSGKCQPRESQEIRHMEKSLNHETDVMIGPTLVNGELHARVSI